MYYDNPESFKLDWFKNINYLYHIDEYLTKYHSPNDTEPITLVITTNDDFVRINGKLLYQLIPIYMQNYYRGGCGGNQSI